MRECVQCNCGFFRERKRRCGNIGLHYHNVITRSIISNKSTPAAINLKPDGENAQEKNAM